MPDKLTKPLVRGLKNLAQAENEFVPIELRGATSSDVADQLVALGLAERGSCEARWQDQGYAVGYRLTRDGFTALHDRRLYS